MNSIKHNKLAYKDLEEGVNLLCNAVKVTLGPKGKNVLIINNYSGAHLTKDGITVAKSVKSDDCVVNGIINTVREASANTAKSAGDGTTTTLVLTQALFNNGLDCIKSGCNPTTLKEEMNNALDTVIKYIQNKSHKITLEDSKLEEIAYISSNNDKDVANIAVEAVRIAEDGVINIEDSKNQESHIKANKGFTFERSYISNHFINGDKTTIEYEDPYIFVSNVELSLANATELLQHAKNNNKPIIIIAPEFNENIFTFLLRNHMAGAVKVCAIKSPGFAADRSRWLEDLTCYIDSEVYTNNKISAVRFLGSANKILISPNETSIINDTLSSKCIDHIAKLENRLKDEDIEEFEYDVIRKRLAVLNGKVVTIFVGATTELELKEKKDRIEDAVCALQAALKGGISEGGGMTFYKASLKSYDYITPGELAVKEALKEPFTQLCINSGISISSNDLLHNISESKGYNFKTDSFENLMDNGVVDPTLVLVNAITNAVGIVSNLLTTDCIVYYE